jgi:uncharacterized membrane protein YdfJ with MMPL/SSD domain
MKYVKLNLFIILITLTFILVPSFALISSSQSNDTLSDDTSSNQTFSSLSHSFGENQSESDDEADQQPDD